MLQHLTENKEFIFVNIQEADESGSLLLVSNRGKKGSKHKVQKKEI